MGKWIHRLSSLDFETNTAECAACGEVSIRLKGKDKQGRLIYRCRNAHMEDQKARTRPWSLFKEQACVLCGFTAEHPCQLDVDHINGNQKDNSLENLQTLCANCHRLKTWKNKDWENKPLAGIA